jgi:ADP-ribose pyrophosphatase
MTFDVCIRKTREVYRGPVLRVTMDEVELSGGRTVELEMVRHPGAAAIAPVDADGNVVLVRQIRYASGGSLLEVPAGKLESGETADGCAARELREEAGLTAREWTPLGAIWTSPGFSDERIHLYLATGLTSIPQQLDPDEVLTIMRMPLREAVERALAGDIDDAKTVCALLRAWQHLAPAAQRA